MLKDLCCSMDVECCAVCCLCLDIVMDVMMAFCAECWAVMLGCMCCISVMYHGVYMCCVTIKDGRY